MTKARLLAILRGTERFLEDLLNIVNSKGNVNERKLGRQAVMLIKQYHQTCLTAATDSMLAMIAFGRVISDTFLSVGAIWIQMTIYDTKEKLYRCNLNHLWAQNIMCTVPILDLLDIVWSLNIAALLLTTMINFYLVYDFYNLYKDKYQPLFYNNLPYGDYDDFNENVIWEDQWTKVSYRLLLDIFEENNPIMTRVYSLIAMQPEDRKKRWKERLARKKERREARALWGSSVKLALKSKSNPKETDELITAPGENHEKEEGKSSKRVGFVEDDPAQTDSDVEKREETGKQTRRRVKRRAGRGGSHTSESPDFITWDYLLLILVGILPLLLLKYLFTE